MQAIGEITIRRRGNTSDVRAKVNDALRLLGLHELEAARIGSACSDLARAITALPDNRGALRLLFEPGPRRWKILVASESERPLSFPASVTRLLGEPLGGATQLLTRATFELGVHRPRRAPGADDLQAAKHALSVPSREDLLIEVQEQNIVLEAQQRKLRRAVEETRRADQAKSNFLANMSHELRTPMNSIIGFTKRLLKRLPDKIPARDLDALSTVSRNANHLLSLINDILDLSKVEAGRMELEPESVDLVLVLEEVLSQSAPLVESKQQQLELVLDPSLPRQDGVTRFPAVIDRRKIYQVVTNLVSNAIKYSDGGVIRVRLGAGNDASLGPLAMIRVSDQGSGLTSEQQASLFRAFTRLDTEATRKIGGTGLGLTISAHFVRMHGGRIDVASQLGEGTEFIVTIPADCTTEAARKQNRQAVAAEGRAATTLLWLDADPELAPLAQVALDGASVEILWTAKLDRLHELIRMHDPDQVYVSRETLHACDRAALEELLGEVGTASVDVREIAVATAPKPGATQDAFEVAAFLRKPIDPSDLTAICKELCPAGLNDVLIVEDMVDVANLMRTGFSEAGIETRVAESGAEALSYLAHRLPSLLLLDLVMPVASGFEVLEVVEERYPRLTVVVLSGLSMNRNQYHKLMMLRRAVGSWPEGAVNLAQLTSARVHARDGQPGRARALPHPGLPS
ncbi:MAG: ATP-binding protein [Myxococcales bacterium]|nr:ATP-binding protein [Myxococcales bacterium]